MIFFFVFQGSNLRLNVGGNTNGCFVFPMTMILNGTSVLSMLSDL